LTKDEQSVVEGWLGLGLESAFLCFACAEAVYTAGKKNKQRRSAKSRPFFERIIFLAISAPNMSGSGTFRGEYLKTTK